MKTFKKSISIIAILTIAITSAFSTVAVFADTEADIVAEEQTSAAQVLNQDEEAEEAEPAEAIVEEAAAPVANEGEEGDGEETGVPGDSSETLKSGAVKDEDGKWRYYVVSDETSAAKTGTGWVSENGTKVYYLVNGVLATGWQSIKYDSKTTYKYYFGNGSEEPKRATGYREIGGKGYYFVTSGAKIGAMYTTPIVNSKGILLLCPTKSGALRTGWVAYKNRTYYFYTKTSGGRHIGCRAVNYQVNRNIKIGSAGYIGGKRGKALAYGIKTLNKNGWSLKSAYKYCYKLKYANRPYRPKTVAIGAIYGFSKKKGNCYVMNCCFHVMADLMGYEVRQVKSSVGPWRAPHSWLEIKQDGKWWVYDANFRNETGRNGFKIYYGKKGTWRYNRSKKYLKKY